MHSWSPGQGSVEACQQDLRSDPVVRKNDETSKQNCKESGWPSSQHGPVHSAARVGELVSVWLVGVLLKPAILEKGTCSWPMHGLGQGGHPCWTGRQLYRYKLQQRHCVAARHRYSRRTLWRSFLYGWYLKWIPVTPQGTRKGTKFKTNWMDKTSKGRLGTAVH